MDTDLHHTTNWDVHRQLFMIQLGKGYSDDCMKEAYIEFLQKLIDKERSVCPKDSYSLF